MSRVFRLTPKGWRAREEARLAMARMGVALVLGPRSMPNTWDRTLQRQPVQDMIMPITWAALPP